MTVLPSGERAVLIETADADRAHALAAQLRALADFRIEDIVPGAGTVLVVARAPEHLAGIVALAESAPSTAVSAAHTDPVVIEVEYDGADLADVAALTGLSTAEVVRRHRESEFVVEFVGFAPGFGYLRGLDPALQVPRLDNPRTAVPAGSVAIAGRYGAVYPRSSPGGWRLLGRTQMTLFDVEADPPALLTAGTRVRFVER